MSHRDSLLNFFLMIQFLVSADLTSDKLVGFVEAGEEV
jgi:hypothetical protein